MGGAGPHTTQGKKPEKKTTIGEKSLEKPTSFVSHDSSDLQHA